MGNIILTTGSIARIPYFFEKCYVNLFSIEELCCCLVENAEMLDTDIVSDKLAKWIKDQCMLPDLADELYRLIKEKASPAAWVEAILSYVGLYPPGSIAHTVSLVSENAGLSPYEKQKARADHLLRNRRYKLALEQYSALLSGLADKEEALKASLHHNSGVAYAGLFMFDHAAREFMQAYEISGNEESLERFLAAKRLGSTEKEYVDYIADNSALHEISLRVEHMIDEAAEGFDATRENRMLFTLRVCKDEGAATAADVQYYDEIESLTAALKDEYRESVSG